MAALLVVLVPIVARPSQADAQAAAVVINEFLAVNTVTLADNTGEFEDWIELHNTATSAVDLGGWTIADGGNSFTFAPGTTISSDEYLVMWASGDITRSAAGFLHLPFKLSGDGESLTLRDSAGVLSEPSWATSYPAQIADASYGIASGGQIRYFATPTPGAANGGGLGGLVSPVTFSVPHGFFDSAQTVVLSTTTTGAQIRYTLDGSTPTDANGLALASGGSVTVADTSVVRAIAYRSGWASSAVETRSYLFSADIASQSTVAPEGWPADQEINGMRAFYGVDPTLTAAERAQVEQSLTAIPTMSITTDLDNLFDPATGIWTNPRERGIEWEAPVSIELIDPTGAQPGFDINGGLRLRGNSSRELGNFKHSMRLVFNDTYGDGELNYPLFGNEGVGSYESVDLKTAQSWSWQRPSATRVGRGTETTWLRDVWNRDSQGAMGQPYARGRFVHAFINGQYWGLYMTEERVSNQHAADYTGGNEEDFDVIKRDTSNPAFADALHVEARDGTLDDWLSLWPLVEDHSLTDTEWAQFRNEVDLENLADFYVLMFYGGDSDSTPRFTLDRSNNWLAFRNRAGVGEAARWQFNDRDSESALCTDTDAARPPDWNPTPPWNLDAGVGTYLPPENFLAPAWLFEAALTQPEFVQIFQDRVQMHLVDPAGALSIDASLARLNARAAVVDLAVDAEAARWGDTWISPGFGRADWEQATQTVRECFQLRRTVIEQYLREDGLWPESDPAQITPAGGAVAFGTEVTVTSAGGTVWITTDGSDPRAADGSPSATAVQYSGPFAITGDTTVRARVQLAAGDWSPLAEETYQLSTPAGPVVVALNELNAVSSSRFLGGGVAGDIANGSDATLGRIEGNGGDWFELVVIEDNLDLRGWTIDIWTSDTGVAAKDASLTFGNDPILNDLLAGTIITISEDIADDVSYDPRRGDWHINLQSNTALAGSYITAGTQSNFAISNDNTQIALFDDAGTARQLRTGEGTVPGVSVSSTEVLKLEGEPTSALTPTSTLYNDGTTSTWGLPNVWANGTETQTLADLRIVFGDVDCDGLITIGDALMIAQYSVLTRDDTDTCPLGNPRTQLFAAAGDVDDDGSVDIGDALLIAQCTVGLTNVFCP